MPTVELRVKKDNQSSADLKVSVQEKTFDYLMTSNAPEIRVSTYLEEDVKHVGAQYDELFVNKDCKYESKVEALIPGSRTRKHISLPGQMYKGEQLTVLVSRKER